MSADVGVLDARAYRDVMEAIGRRPLRVSALREMPIDPAGFAAWLLPAVLVVYLALSNGGYGIIERSEVGIAVWWVVLIGTLIGVLPVAGGTRTGRAMLAILGAFAAWTALSMIWTESAERTSIELARVSAYLGVFALALAVQGEGRWRHLLNGVTTGAAVVCGIAVLSRLEPTWFPKNTAGQFLPGIQIQSRLAYPLNYSSGLGAFAAICLPLLLGATAWARTLAAQALAAAALPVAALTLWLTASGLSVLATVVALGAFLLLAPDRLPKLATLGIASAGSAILFAAISQRDALDRGLPTPSALHQGNEMELVLLVVCVGVALAQTGVGLAVRYGHRPAWMQISRKHAWVATGTTLLATLAVAIAAGLPTQASDRWDEFKYGADGSAPTESRGTQILDFGGSGRYQFWQSAIDANKTDPLIGIGPGTFEYWWSSHGSYAGFVTDAHSLYLETLAELGIVGLVLVGGFALALLGIGTARVLRAPPHLRVGIAAATAGCAAFLASAAVDWVWELGVLPLIFLILGAVVVAGGREASMPRRRGTAGWQRYGSRAVIAGLAVAALVAIAIPLAGASAVEQSQRDAATNRLGVALERARDAAEVQSYAATPYLQQALVLEQRGDFAGAVENAKLATDKEATNFRTWLTLSRLEAEAGHAQASVEAYHQARSLNPKSGLFPQ